MSLRYSPLCETDPKAYYLYLLANGCGSFVSRSQCGAAGDSQFGGVSDDDGRGDDLLFDRVDFEGKAWLVCLRKFALETGLFGGVNNSIGDPLPAVAWVSGGGVHSGGGVVGGGYVDGVGESIGEASVADGDAARSVRTEPVPVVGAAGSDESGNPGSSGSSLFDVMGFCLSCGKKHGKWYHHNKAKRYRKKVVMRPEASSCVVADDGGLKESLREKWKAENKLARLKAERQFELLQAQSVDDVKRMQRAQVLRTTETCKVQVERAFRSLKKTGNVAKDQGDVPADGSGSAKTVISEDGVPSLSRSDGSGISPDSSVSQQEIRQMQKDLLDAAEEKKKFDEMMGYLKAAVPEQYKVAEFRANCKKAYTLDSQGQAEIDTVGSIRDGKFYPDFLHEHYAPNPLHRSARNEVPFPGEEDLW